MKNPPTILDLTESLRPQMEEVDWIVKAPASHLTALHVRDGLGSLPRRLNKTYVQFDFDETRTYGGLPGSKLAGFAAKIVLTARDETRLLKTIRGMVIGLLGPLVAYLRVNLAMTRLEEAITQSCHPGRDPGPREVMGGGFQPLEVPDKLRAMPETFRDDRFSVSPVPTGVDSFRPEGREIDDRLSMNARPSGFRSPDSCTAPPSVIPAPGMTSSEITPSCHPALDAGPREAASGGFQPLEVPDKPKVFRDDRGERSRPAFRWRASPASIYNFKQKTAELGYDPRETSAYWIERRANALRRRWTAYAKQNSCEPDTSSVAGQTKRARREIIPPNSERDDVTVEDFVPAAAHYGEIWPPLMLPPGPPKAAGQAQDHCLREPEYPEGEDGSVMNARLSGSRSSDSWAAPPSVIPAPGMTVSEIASICHHGRDPGPRELADDGAFSPEASKLPGVTKPRGLARPAAAAYEFMGKASSIPDSATLQNCPKAKLNITEFEPATLIPDSVASLAVCDSHRALCANPNDVLVNKYSMHAKNDKYLMREQNLPRAVTRSPIMTGAHNKMNCKTREIERKSP